MIEETVVAIDECIYLLASDLLNEYDTFTKANRALNAFDFSDVYDV